MPVLAAVVVVVLAGVWLTGRTDAPTDTGPTGPGLSSLTATWQDGTVLVTGRHPGSGDAVDVTARFEGGSGSALMITDDDGSFDVAFRPPAGVAGDVEVTAVSDKHRHTETVPVTPGDGPPPEPVAGGPLVVPMTGAPATSPAADPSGLPRYDVPTGIAADCSADVTDALNSWLEGVPDDSEIVFPERACYRVDGSLTLEERSGLVIEGSGSTFRAGTPVPTPETNRAQWRTDYGADIVLRDMTLVGLNTEPRFNPDNEFDHNLFIRGTTGVTVDNVHGRGAYGDFIAIAHGTDRETIPGDIEIRNSSAETVGRMAISCVACDGVTVENSVFNDVGYHVFDLEVEEDGWPTRGIRYTGNTIGRHGHAFFSVGTPFQTYDNDVSDIVIADNLVTQPGATEGDCVPPISFVYNKVPVHDVVIQGNSLVSRTDAIVVKNASDVTIHDNRATLVQPTCGDPVGIRTPSTESTDVSGNELAGYG